MCGYPQWEELCEKLEAILKDMEKGKISRDEAIGQIVEVTGDIDYSDWLMIGESNGWTMSGE